MRNISYQYLYHTTFYTNFRSELVANRLGNKRSEYKSLCACFGMYTWDRICPRTLINTHTYYGIIFLPPTEIEKRLLRENTATKIFNHSYFTNNVKTVSGIELLDIT